eukprot:603997-Rhodomonas_salina.2
MCIRDSPPPPPPLSLSPSSISSPRPVLMSRMVLPNCSVLTPRMVLPGAPGRDDVCWRLLAGQDPNR